MLAFFSVLSTQAGWGRLYSDAQLREMVRTSTRPYKPSYELSNEDEDPDNPIPWPIVIGVIQGIIGGLLNNELEENGIPQYKGLYKDYIRRMSNDEDPENIPAWVVPLIPVAVETVTKIAIDAFKKYGHNSLEENALPPRFWDRYLKNEEFDPDNAIPWDKFIEPAISELIKIGGHIIRQFINNPNESNAYLPYHPYLRPYVRRSKLTK